MSEATLTGPAERALTIRIEGYANEVADNDYDANWLLVEVACRDGDLTWTGTGRALLSWELLELAAWFDGVASAPPGTHVFSGLTGLLQFEAEGDPPTVAAVLTEDLAPPKADRHEGGVIAFEPGRDGLRAFAAGVRALADGVPVRPVEPGGYASSFLGGAP